MKSFIHNKLILKNIYKICFSIFSVFLFLYTFLKGINDLFNLNFDFTKIIFSIILIIILLFTFYKFKNLNFYVKEILKIFILPVIFYVLFCFYILFWSFNIIILREFNFFTFINSNIVYFFYLFDRKASKLENILYYIFINLLFFWFYIYLYNSKLF